MQKIILVSTLMASSLLADTSLGQKLSVAPAQENISDTPLSTRVNPHRQNTNNNVQTNNGQTSNQNHLTTRVAPSQIKRGFREDDHRYDKRYANFDYDQHGYYNDDGYYYGYYDTTGYFYNNIFFSYNRNYTYNDRYYRRGFFRHGHRHHRTYVYHTFNDWNRVHCYREPNVIVRGHYYDRAYYPRRNYNHHYRSNYYGSHYNNYRSPARMNVTRMNGHNNSNRHYNERNNYSNHGNTRMHVNRNNSRVNNSRNYSNRNSYRNNSSYRNNNSYRSNSRTQMRRSPARMSTSRGSSGRHMGMSR